MLAKLSQNNQQGEKDAIVQGSRVVVHTICRHKRVKGGSPGGNLRSALELSSNAVNARTTFYNVEFRKLTDGLQGFPCRMSVKRLHKKPGYS